VKALKVGDCVEDGSAAITPSEEARALLQRRVSGFAAVVGWFNAIAVVGRTAVIYFAQGALDVLPHHTLTVQGLSALSFIVIWALTRSGKRSATFVRAVEAIGTFVACSAFVVMSLMITERVVTSDTVRDFGTNPDHQIVILIALVGPLSVASFALTYVLVLRATFVPTSPRHTAILTLVIGAPLVVIAYRAGIGIEALELGILGTPLITAGSAVQWAFTVAVCAAISQVVYGLREEVRSARRLGQYTLEALIGEGGMGRVYRASHAMLRRPTAIKLLSPARGSADALGRFEREVQMTAQLKHPNVVTIYDYGRTADGVLYYAMELLDGATLEDVIEVDGPQPAARVVNILEQVAGALGEAHSIGLIHRDIKPANIVICRQGGELDVAKVVDFGLVKEMEERHAVAVSQEGTISGTPLYMAPEILTGDANAASARSDLYALGAVGYYLLTGEHVFGGRTVIEVLGHHLHTEPIPPSQRLGDAVPEDLERVILDCLNKDPNKRPQSGSELRMRLEACERPGRWTQKSAKKWWDAHGPIFDARRAKDFSQKSARTVDVRRSAA
jgi:hypothetical protein